MRGILIALLCSISQMLLGQEAKYLIKNYNISDNFNPPVWTMVEDTMGILYFGVDGYILTCNGSEWKTFHNGKGLIRSLYKDSHGDIWYGTINDFGRVAKSADEGITLESYSQLLPDSLRQFGNVWTIREIDSTHFFQTNTRVFALKKGRLTVYPFVGITQGFEINGKYVVDEHSAGLLYLSSSGFKPLQGGDFYKQKAICGTIELSKDSILICSRNNGVMVYHIPTGITTEGFPSHPEIHEALKRNRIYNSLLLPNGNFAFSTLYNGTYITTRTGKLDKILHYQSGTIDNTHYHIGLSHDHTLWMCTSNGISSINVFAPLANWDHTKGLEGLVMSINEHNGGILVGTLIGLFFLPDPLNPHTKVQPILNAQVRDILRLKVPGSTSTKLLIAGDGVFEMAGLRVDRIMNTGLILKATQLNADPNYVLAFGANDLHVFRLIKGKLEYVTVFRNLFYEFRTVAQDKTNFIWLGTRSLKLIRFRQRDLIQAIERNNGSQLHPYRLEVGSLTDVHSIDDRIIFSDITGLLDYDSTQKAFRKFTGLGPEAASYPKMVSAMSVDRKGNIWVGGNDLFINRQDGTYALHRFQFDPLKDIYSAFAFYHDNVNRTWIGGNKGLYLFDSNAFNQAIEYYPVIIERVVKDSVIHYTYCNGTNKPTQARLYFKNGKNISVVYTLPHYSNDFATQYSYLLENFSDSWSSWRNEYYTSFSYLRPGEYTFWVKARTANGYISEPTSIRFYIEKPWYITNLVIAGYLIAIGLLLYLVYIYNVRRKIRREVLIENIIQKRLQQQHILNLVESRKIISNQGVSAKEGKPMVEVLKSKITERDMGKQERFMNQLLDVIEENLGDYNFSVEKLCKLMDMSQALLYKKIKSHTSLSINSFIRKIRLKKAAQLLIETDLSVSEIAYKVGFNDPGYFTKCFHQEFGQSPKHFQRNPYSLLSD